MSVLLAVSLLAAPGCTSLTHPGTIFGGTRTWVEVLSSKSSPHMGGFQLLMIPLAILDFLPSLAMDVALLMILRLYNRATAAQVRHDLAAAQQHAAEATPSVGERLTRWWAARTGARGPMQPHNEELDTSAWIELELVPDSSAAPARSPWQQPTDE